MKKVISILAMIVLSIGLFSCEAENNIEETEALYDIEIVDATDDDEGSVEENQGSGGN